MALSLVYVSEICKTIRSRASLERCSASTSSHPDVTRRCSGQRFSRCDRPSSVTRVASRNSKSESALRLEAMERSPELDTREKWDASPLMFRLVILVMNREIVPQAAFVMPKAPERSRRVSAVQPSAARRLTNASPTGGWRPHSDTRREVSPPHHEAIVCGVFPYASQTDHHSRSLDGACEMSRSWSLGQQAMRVSRSVPRSPPVWSASPESLACCKRAAGWMLPTLSTFSDSRFLQRDARYRACQQHRRQTIACTHTHTDTQTQM